MIQKGGGGGGNKKLYIEVHNTMTERKKTELKQ